MFLFISDLEKYIFLDDEKSAQFLCNLPNNNKQRIIAEIKMKITVSVFI